MAKKKKKPMSSDAKGLICIAVGFLLFTALLSFSFLHPEKNWLGYLGYLLSLALEFLFGLGSYLISAYLMFLGYRLIKKEKNLQIRFDLLCFIALLVSSCMLLSVYAASHPEEAKIWDGKVILDSVHIPYQKVVTRHYLGGFPFYYLYVDLPLINLEQTLSPIGTTLIFSSLLFISFLLLTQVELLQSLWQGRLFCKKGSLRLFAYLRKSTKK